MKLTPSPLSDPFYYLHNMQAVVSWSLHYHRDLLTQSEINMLSDWLNLDTEPRALFSRLVMRKGPFLRTDKLAYPEIPELENALTLLKQANLISLHPKLSITELAPLCRKSEYYDLAKQYLSEPPEKNVSKTKLTELVSAHLSDLPARSLDKWWQDAPFRLIAFTKPTLLERIRLMFFGNLHQNWSEFVLEELGHQRYEKVSFDKSSRAFKHRDEVDHYLQLHDLFEQLESGIALSELTPLIPEKTNNLWLNNRRDKLLFALGHAAERLGEGALALNLYADCALDDALIRRYRLLEKNAPPKDVYNQISKVLEKPLAPETENLLRRIQKRSARKSGDSLAAEPIRPPISAKHLRLKKTGTSSVEQSVAEYLGKNGQDAFFVENHLFTGLFALLFWPALFKPVKGAFFNPFQSAPADLYLPEFSQLREREIQQCLNALSAQSYRDQIKTRYQEKYGISCSLVHWPSLLPDLIELALKIIPAAHLEVIFKRLLLDLKNHRRGFPDLISFNQETEEYCLIEVKGPGDRLQEHQKLWLEYFTENSIPAKVCYVEWDQAPGSTSP